MLSTAADIMPDDMMQGIAVKIEELQDRMLGEGVGKGDKKSYEHLKRECETLIANYTTMYNNLVIKSEGHTPSDCWDPKYYNDILKIYGLVAPQVFEGFEHQELGEQKADKLVKKYRECRTLADNLSAANQKIIDGLVEYHEVLTEVTGKGVAVDDLLKIDKDHIQPLTLFSQRKIKEKFSDVPEIVKLIEFEKHELSLLKNRVA